MDIGLLIVWFGVSAITFLGGCVVFVNYVTVAKSYLSGREPSLFPVLGGLLVGAGMFICPIEAAQQYCWMVLLIDPGCAFLLLKLLYSGLTHRWLRGLFK